MRFMSRQKTQLYDETWRIAEQAGAPVVMIDTFNDLEEGSDIEFGIDMLVDMEDTQPEILLRSSPVQVTWNCARGQAPLQVYRDGRLIYERTHSPGVFLSLASNRAYEIKVWASSSSALSKAIKVRRQDPIPGAAPISVE
jgi:hypothetical protein